MAEYLEDEWQQRRHRTGKKYGSKAPKKLYPLYETEIQDGGRCSSREAQRNPYKTPSPLPQRNRYSALLTPFARGHEALYETDSEEEDFQRQRSAKKQRERSPQKPGTGFDYRSDRENQRNQVPPASLRVQNDAYTPGPIYPNANQCVQNVASPHTNSNNQSGQIDAYGSESGQNYAYTHGNIENAPQDVQQAAIDARGQNQTPCVTPLPQRVNAYAKGEIILPSLKKSSNILPTPDPLMSFPVTDQPITQQFLKDFMISFRATVHMDIGEVRNDVYTLANHVSQITKETDIKISKLERKIEDITTAHNHLVDANRDLLDQNRWMKEKLADIEDRNRRNNVKIRGVPESVSNDNLADYVKDILKTTYPNLTDNDVTIDRAHRLPKPPHIPKHLPRDVITRIHFYHIKEKLLSATKDGKKLPNPFQNLSLFQDLSKATLQARREYYPVTNTLRHRKVDYSWGFPTKLIIYDQGKKHVAKSPREAHSLLTKWEIPIFIPRDPRRDKPIPQQKPTYQVTLNKQLSPPKQHLPRSPPPQHQEMDTTQAPASKENDNPDGNASST